MTRSPNEVAIFVHRDERFLLLRRVDRGVWHVAAGVVEDGESFHEAAARELREETGLDLPPRDLGGSQRYAIPDEDRHLYDARVTHVLVRSFAVAAPPGWEPELNEEHDAHRWCTLDEAMALLHWREAREALGAFARPRGPAPA